MDRVAYDSHDDVDMGEHFWDVLSWQWGMFTTASGSIGSGATVPVEYVQRQGRALFLGALYRVAPGVSQDLLRAEAFSTLDRLARATGEWESALDDSGQFLARNLELFMEQAAEGIKAHPLYGPVAAAEADLDCAIRAWQQRHNLTDKWLYATAWETIIAARLTFGYPDPGPDLLDLLPDGLPLLLDADGRWASPHMDKEDYAALHGIQPGAMTWAPDHKQINIPVYLDGLKHPPRVEYNNDGDPIGEWEGDGAFGTFDPRTETVDAATNRLLETLRPRIRTYLESIEAEDRALNHALPPVTYRSLRPFEWLVRYQVCREGMRPIARSAGKDAGHVSREIHRVKDLIGLTLRPPERKGRPRKAHARTVKVLR